MPDVDTLRSGNNEFEDCVGIARWRVAPPGTYASPHGAAPYAAETSLDLDVASDMLYFLSRGPLSKGSIAIDSHGDTTKVHVAVRFFYSAPDLLQHARVCVLHRDEVNNGVGIYTSPHLESPSGGSFASFQVMVTVPSTIDDEHVSLDALLVLMPLFSIELSDSMDIVNFRSVILETTYSPIRVKSLLTDIGEISSSNGPIEGDFCSTESLDLKTSNAPINCTVTLTSSDPGKPAHLSMTSSNGSIVSQIALVSSAQGGSGSAFKTAIKTSNAPLDIAFTTAPLDSVLHLEGSSSNAPVSVALHHSYEGDLYLSSGGMLIPNLIVDKKVQDPARSGRARTVQTDAFNSRSPGTLEGKVRWGTDENRIMGSVELSTSNGPMMVAL